MRVCARAHVYVCVLCTRAGTPTLPISFPRRYTRPEPGSRRKVATSWRLRRRRDRGSICVGWAWVRSARGDCASQCCLRRCRSGPVSSRSGSYWRVGVGWGGARTPVGSRQHPEPSGRCSGANRQPVQPLSQPSTSWDLITVPGSPTRETEVQRTRLVPLQRGPPQDSLSGTREASG